MKFVLGSVLLMFQLLPGGQVENMQHNGSAAAQDR
jgi:hypothetical protein